MRYTGRPNWLVWHVQMSIDHMGTSEALYDMHTALEAVFRSAYINHAASATIWAIKLSCDCTAVFFVDPRTAIKEPPSTAASVVRLTVPRSFLPIIASPTFELGQVGFALHARLTFALHQRPSSSRCVTLTQVLLCRQMTQCRAG